MARPRWKFNYISFFFYKNFFKKNFKPFRLFRVFSRKSTIPKFLLKKTIAIYKGQFFVKTLINKYTLGYKMGELSFTRKPFKYPQKKKNKR